MSDSISTGTPDSRGSVMYTPRTPRMRQRQRFDLSTWVEEDEIDGLEGKQRAFSYLRKKIESVLQTLRIDVAQKFFMLIVPKM